MFILALSMLLLLGGCGNKEHKENPFESTLSEQDSQPLTKAALQAANPAEINDDADLDSDIEASDDNTSATTQIKTNTFDLTDMTQQHRHITLSEQTFASGDISQPLTLFFFFTPWSLPCQGEVPYLSDLQKKYADSLDVVGVLLNPEKYADDIGTFIQTYHANFFIAIGSENNRFTQMLSEPHNLPDSMPIPLIVIYKNGQYWRHYTGAIPIEMLEHDIKTILNQ